MSSPISRSHFIFLTLLILPFIAACDEGDPEESGVLVRVGEERVTAEDLQRRREVERIGQGVAPAEDSVMVALIREAYGRELAGRLGVEPTDAEIASFAARLDQVGRADLLDSIKRVFGTDTLSYLRHVVEPQVRSARLQQEYAERMRSAPAGEGDSRERMNRALSMVAGSARFSDVASSLLLDHRFDTLRPDTPPDADLRARYGDRITSHPMIPLLDSLAQGEHLRQVLEDRVGYRIVRLVERGAEGVIVEMIEGRKYSFDDWFRDQTADIPTSAEEGSAAGELLRSRFSRQRAQE